MTIFFFFRARVDPSSPNASSMFKSSKPALQVIDFGVSIDMALFPDGTTFTHCFEKMESKSPDMLEGRPWTYQVSVWGAPTKIIELQTSSVFKWSKTVR